MQFCFITPTIPVSVYPALCFEKARKHRIESGTHFPASCGQVTSSHQHGKLGFYFSESKKISAQNVSTPAAAWPGPAQNQGKKLKNPPSQCPWQPICCQGPSVQRQTPLIHISVSAPRRMRRAPPHWKGWIRRHVPLSLAVLLPIVRKRMEAITQRQQLRARQDSAHPSALLPLCAAQRAPPSGQILYSIQKLVTMCSVVLSLNGSPFLLLLLLFQLIFYNLIVSFITGEHQCQKKNLVLI